MMALFVVRAESFHFSTRSSTMVPENLPVHWSLLTGPYCVVTTLRNSFRTTLTDDAANVGLKYAVLFDATWAQHATYILPASGPGGCMKTLLKLGLLGEIACPAEVPE